MPPEEIYQLAVEIYEALNNRGAELGNASIGIIETAIEKHFQSVRCDVPGCHAEAQYQGWYRKLDFAGLSTGLIQNLKVCGGHAPLLIGYKKEG